MTTTPKKKRRKSKRANGEGSIYPWPGGRWKAIVSLGVTSTGGRRRRSRICKSHADAVEAIRELYEEAGVIVPDESRHNTVSGWLNWWLEHVVKKESQENTYLSYKIAADSHISPHIGSAGLKKLSAVQVQTWLTQLQTGPRAIQNAYVVLRTALAKAKEIGIVKANVCEAVNRPAVKKKKIFPFAQKEARSILKAMRDDRLYGVFVLAMQLGMRQGEIFGLQWTDIDWQAKTVHVQRQATEISGRLVVKAPKNTSSIRTVELTTAALNALRARQKVALAEGHAGEPWVFTAPEGGPVRRGNFRVRTWQPVLSRLKLKSRGFHHTRHTYASLALAAGVRILVVSKTLGHAKVSTTLDVYGHVLDDHKSEGTATMQKLLG